MEQVDLKAVHTTMIGFTKRAEKASEESLVATFVDSAPLFSLLSTQNVAYPVVPGSSICRLCTASTG